MFIIYVTTFDRTERRSSVVTCTKYKLYSSNDRSWKVLYQKYNQFPCIHKIRRFSTGIWIYLDEFKIWKYAFKNPVLDTSWVFDKNSGKGSIQREKWRTSFGIGANLDTGKARRKSSKFYAKNIGCYTTWESFNKMLIRLGKIWSRLISNSSTRFPRDLKSPKDILKSI